MLAGPRFSGHSLGGRGTIYKDLKKILKNLANDLNTKLLDGFQFFAWLKHLLSQTMVNEPGYEQSGIQVLGLIEARGLAFDRLFLAGMSKGSLPQPVRTFPFLARKNEGRFRGPL